MTTFKWTISGLDVAPTDSGPEYSELQNVVKRIHWSLSAQEDGFIVEVKDATSIDAPNPSSFVEFDDLTEDYVVSLLSSRINIEKIKKDLQKQLELLKNPPMVTKMPPWIN